MPKEFPPNPNLAYDRKQAKALLKAYRGGDAEATERVRGNHPQLQNIPDAHIPPAEFKLSDAQLVIAREYGCSSWPALKHRIETTRAGLAEKFGQLAEAVKAEDTATVRTLLTGNPGLAAHIDDPAIDFDSPALVIAAGRNNRKLVDALLDHGADINARSAWWAGAFGVLHDTDPDMARYLITRGAKVDIFAASRLNQLETVREMIEADPSLAHAKGPDGQRALHFARSREMIDLLLAHGAEIDARDIDHRGTAAQTIVCDKPDLCLYLLERGATPDIFMATALGNQELVARLLNADPRLVDLRIGGADYPAVPPAPGGHIYVYTLGNHKSPHQIALRFRHDAVANLLLERSSVGRRFVSACERGDIKTARALAEENPGIVAALPTADHALLADAAELGNLPAVRFLLDLGFSVRPDDSGMTPLHTAGFHGFIEIVRLLLEHHPPLETRNAFGGTPLDSTVFGVTHSWRKDGDFPATVEALIAAGAKVDAKMLPSGSAAVDAMLRRALGEPEPPSV